MIYTYVPKGVCAMKMIANIENKIIVNFQIIGGCSGNTQAVSKLIIGKTIDETIKLLKGIKCGFKPTSCPDQIAKFLIKIKNQ